LSVLLLDDDVNADIQLLLLGLLLLSLLLPPPPPPPLLLLLQLRKQRARRTDPGGKRRCGQTLRCYSTRRQPLAAPSLHWILAVRLAHR
jgi:hypothetical protein